MKFERYTIEVFYPGTHVNANGEEITYTIDDLRGAAEAYNRDLERGFNYAPVVIGHPEENAPAFGYIEKAFIRDNALWFTIRVSERLAGWIKEGLYRERSVSFWRIKDEEAGTVIYRIQHLGFLGGVHPALGQLKDQGLPVNGLPPKSADSQYKRFPAVQYTFQTDGKWPSLTKENFTMDEQTRQEVVDIVNEITAPILESITELNGKLETLMSELGSGDIEVDPDEVDEADATKDDNNKADKPKSDESETVKELRRELEAVRRDNALTKFNAYLERPEVRQRLSAKAVDKMRTAYNKLADSGRAYDRKGNDTEEVKSLKDIIGELSPVVEYGAEYSNGRSSVNYSTSDRTDEADTLKSIKAAFSKK